MALPEVLDANPAMELVAPHCDIADRLNHVPPSARMRGLWFKVIEAEMTERGHLPEYRRYFPADRFRTLGFYWCGDYLLRAAVGGALISGPEELHAGMFEIARHNATRFANTLVGRTMIRLLSPQPMLVVRQGIAARRQTISYGRWSLGEAGPGTIEIEFRQEYMWIESHVAGSWKGTFEAIGVDAEVRTALSDRFNGTVTATWEA